MYVDNAFCNLFKIRAFVTGGLDRDHIKAPRRKPRYNVHLLYIKDDCKFDRVGSPDLYQSVIALGISYGGVWEGNYIHYLARPLGWPGGMYF